MILLNIRNGTSSDGSKFAIASRSYDSINDNNRLYAFRDNEFGGIKVNVCDEEDVENGSSAIADDVGGSG